MTAYYNEHDPFAAAWLRELIKDGHIALGDVDERDIQDVCPDELASYTQCHFFAGIGGWSYALRLAGWPDDRPVWTGSPPCQPFSAAGKGGGFADERHLWPAWFWLIHQCQPSAIFGEQVSSKAGLEWWDVVAADLEAQGYGCGAFDLSAAGAGAFHIRQRLYWVADAAHHNGRAGVSRKKARIGQEEKRGRGLAGSRINGALAQPGGKYDGRDNTRESKGAGMGMERGELHSPRRQQGANGFDPRGHAGVAQGDASSPGLAGRQSQPGNNGAQQQTAKRTGGIWSNAIWLQCTDGKARATKPGLFPLAHGVSNRVGTLRGAGNAIVPQIAAEFIRAYMEI